MKLTTVFMLGVPISFAYADCYTGGEKYSDSNNMYKFFGDACRNFDGQFTGYYAPMQTKAFCGKHLYESVNVLFEVQNMNDHEGFTLKPDDCWKQFDYSAQVCGKHYGFEYYVDGWRYR